jgi:hypothetical protein
MRGGATRGSRELCCPNQQPWGHAGAVPDCGIVKPGYPQKPAVPQPAGSAGKFTGEAKIGLLLGSSPPNS